MLDGKNKGAAEITALKEIRTVKKVLGSIAIILLVLLLGFSLYVRDTTPDRKAVKNIENAALGSGELKVIDHYENENSTYVLVFGDDEYDYSVKGETGDILSIHINDQSRQKLDKALVESGGERIPEEEANEIFKGILTRYFPQADKENVKLERTGNHLEEFVYSTESVLSNGETAPVYIALAFNGELSGISTVSLQAVEPELQREKAPEEVSEEAAEPVPAEPEPTEIIPVDAGTEEGNAA